MSAAPMPPQKKKKKRWTAADAARQANRDQRRMYEDKRQRDQEATYAAQRFPELTDGSSQKITKRGVRQRGMSDAEAGAMIRGEIAAGKAKPAAPADPSAFSPSGMGKPIALRSEGERMARIAGSPVTGSAKPVFSTKGSGSGDFSADQSAAYRKRALAMGASAKPDMSGFAGTSGNPQYSNLPPDPFKAGGVGQGVDVNSAAGQKLRQGFEPQPMSPPRPASPAPAPAMAPKRVLPDLTGRGQVNPAHPMAPTASPEPMASVRAPQYGEPGFKTAAQFATGMTPQLREQSAKLDASYSGIVKESAGIKNPYSSRWKGIEERMKTNFAESRSIREIAKRNAPMQNEQMAMTAQGMAGPPRAAKAMRDPSLALIKRSSGIAGARV